MVAAFAFACEGPGELSVEQGEVLLVEAAPRHAAAPPGWTLVRSAAGLGFVPSSYLLPAAQGAAAASAEAPPLPLAFSSPPRLSVSALLARSLPHLAREPPQQQQQQQLQPFQPRQQPQQPLQDTQYARGYLDAVSRMLIEARLAVREAEALADAQGLGSSIIAQDAPRASHSSSSSSSNIYLSIPSTSARPLERQRGPQPASLAALQAHVGFVARLEHEAARALEAMERGAGSGGTGRRRAPPPLPQAQGRW